MFNLQTLFINQSYALLCIKKLRRVSAIISGHHLGALIVVLTRCLLHLRVMWVSLLCCVVLQNISCIKRTRKVLSLQQAMKTKTGSRCIAVLFLTSALDGGWVVNATPRLLYPREWPPTPCIGGWVGPRAGLKGCGKSRPHRDSITGSSSP